MDDKFTTYATAEIMIDNISYSDAEALCGKLKNIKDVKEITFDDTSDHYATAAALF